ncbi:hypothetical protein BCR36DRAFT_374335 [Piromyces finnis]|uniref:Uncharacterized protein n=1 Tax=Piromyces finnis TaxID=1754191 RepID=A0A1Y1UX19_9FUNG|nr:hypothetical protein BCR36DRAFT_374335 [Piromyces finnis]|eukprot:ORX42710.1 hypothetical protein BCR36DRAFT_374335 [Piromyces finnis]
MFSSSSSSSSKCAGLKIPRIEEDASLFCDTMNTNKCQKFLEESVPKIYECLGEDNLSETLCTKGDDGKYCPITYAVKDDERYNYVINESCKSKVCTDASYTILELELGTIGLDAYKNKTFNEVFDIKDANPHGDSDYYSMAYLKSEQCTSKQPSPKSSDATTLNYSILATTLFALLYALF